LINKTINKVLELLKLAIDSRDLKITTISLDAIQKLLAYGQIYGKCIDEKGEVRKTMEWVVEIINSCFTKTDHPVQMQILNV